LLSSINLILGNFFISDSIKIETFINKEKINRNMKKIEQVYREILYQAIEKKNKTLTQKAIALALKISLSTVNHALEPLRKMGAIKVNPRNFTIINIKKILYFWASKRSLEKDIVYTIRVEKSPRQIEQSVPQNTIFTAYSGYKFKFKKAPADYSEVYVYSDDFFGIKRRFPAKKGTPNLFILKKDPNMNRYKTITIANLFVDIWNLKEWYAKDFLKELEGELSGILE